MVACMAKEKSKREPADEEDARRGVGRPRSPKIGIFCRIKAESVEALDQMIQEMRPEPTRSSLIDLAVEEYVQRWRAKKN